MASRRQFIAGSISSSVLMTSIAARAETLLDDHTNRSVAAFVYDDRFALGPAIAQDLAQWATAIFSVSGDVAELWYDRLLPDLRQGSRAIGGLTTAGSLFVLARLSQDAGLTLALHGQHCLAESGEAESLAMDAPVSIKQGYEAAVAGGTPWQVALQVALLEAAATPLDGYQNLSGMGPFAVTRRETLHSWLLVPRTSLQAGNMRIGQ